MRPRSVFLVEDRETQRISYKFALANRGFHVDEAGNAHTARQIIQAGREYDVAVLDMRLDDPEEPHVTGAELGLELSRVLGTRAPEYLIYSAYPRPDYYEQALRLGAAVYLNKAHDSDARDLVRYVRALVLRRALSVKEEGVVQRIHGIAVGSPSPWVAVYRFCHDILRPELEENLGNPFILLLTTPRGKLEIISNIDVPEESYKKLVKLQSFIFLEPVVDVFFLDSTSAAAVGLSDGDQVFKDSAFLQLAGSEGFQLSLGILQPLGSGRRYDNAQSLAEVLIRYFRNAVLDHLLNMAATWTKYAQSRKAILSATSRFCLRIGQEQVTLIDEARRSAGEELDHQLQRLHALGEELRDTGELLDDLNRTTLDDSSPGYAQRGEVAMDQLVQEIWKSYRQDVQLEGLKLTVAGKCVLHVDRESMTYVISDIIEWLSQANPSHTGGIAEKEIIVKCEQEGTTARVVFDDNGLRLPEEVRKILFEPFTSDLLRSPSPTAPSKDSAHLDRQRGHRLGLYRAKVLVELRNNGFLEDRSSDLPGDAEGNRLVLSFPVKVGA